MGDSTLTFVPAMPDLWLGSCPESAQDVERLKSECTVTAVLELHSDVDIEVLELN